MMIDIVQIVGPQGEQGDKGDKGDNGNTGPQGPPVPNETTIGFTEILTDAPTTIWTDATPLALWEVCKIAALVDIEQIGAHAQGGAITRTAQVQNVSGVVTDVLTQATSGWDRDVSTPPPPANLATAVQATIARIVASGTTLAVQVTRPAGVPIRARAVISASRQTRPAVAYALSASPAFGPDAGGTTVTILGEGLAAVSAVTLAGTPATIVSTADLQVVVTAQAGSGAGDIVLVTPLGNVTIPNAWSYTAGVIPVVTSISPNVATADGGNGALVITGSGFTGALGVTIGGVTQVYTVNSDTQITIPSPAQVTDNTKWGLGDVIVTSRTNNANAPGNQLFFYLPTGFLSWHRADMATFDGSNNLLTFPDRITSTPVPNLFKGGSIPFAANDVGGRGSVVVGTFGTFDWNKGAAVYYTGAELSVLMIGRRPSPDNTGHAVLLEAADMLDNNDGTTRSNGFTVLDTSTADTIGRAGVLAASSGAAIDTTHAFCLSVRVNASTATMRLNGVDVAQIPSSGNMHFNCLSVQRGMSASGQLTSASVPELRLADIMVMSRSHTVRDLQVLSAYVAWYYTGLPSV